MAESHTVCIVTGANAGIGKATAMQLAARGVTVVMACRNAERGARAQAEVKDYSKSSAVHVMALDTSSMRSVRDFARNFQNRFERLHVLINNAGNFDLRAKNPQITDEGHETIFATNYLGPWLLTRLLIDSMQATSTARVINVGSKGLMTFPCLSVEFDNLDGAKKFGPVRAYYHSKLAALSFTHELARRYGDRGIVATMVRVPAVRVDLDRLQAYSGLVRALYKLKRWASITPTQMAETYTWLALAPEAAELNGAYVNEHRHVVSSPRRAQDSGVGERLWRCSAALVGE